jgi:hypothetical protein
LTAQLEYPASIRLLLAANGLVWVVQVYSQMKLGATLSLVLLALVFTPCFGQTPGNPPPESKYPIVRLPPTTFSELPKNLVTELKRRGCTIPQVAGFKKRQNVIRGEFAKPGQTDWAILCYRAKFLGLYVFWNASEMDMAIVRRWQLPEPLPAPFETAIAPVSREYILDHYRALGGPKPPPMDHQGIECSSGMASGILYFYKGKWLTLQGAD